MVTSITSCGPHKLTRKPRIPNADAAAGRLFPGPVNREVKGESTAAVKVSAAEGRILTRSGSRWMS